MLWSNGWSRTAILANDEENEKRCRPFVVQSLQKEALKKIKRR
jgi:hypothetical protein